jgi:DNA-binding NtrC family response regulator
MLGLTVVVVDDDEDNVFVLEMGLQSAGFEVKTARSLSEARAVLEAGGADALVTDYSLGDGTAVELLTALGAKRPRLAILVTGHSDAEHFAESRAAGFDAHLVKPIDLGQLERTLRGTDAPASGSTSSSGA